MKMAWSHRAQNNGRRSPVMVTGQIFFGWTNLYFGRSDNEYNDFFPLYGISNYAGNRSLYCIDVQVFSDKLVKFIHKLLSSFPGFSPAFMSLYIYFDFEYHRTAVSQVSKSHSCISVKFDLFRCPAGDQKSPPLNNFGKEVDLARNPFHKQRIYHQKSINIQQSFHLGRTSRNTLSWRAHYKHRILFTVGNVDRDIGWCSGRYSGRHSVDSPSTLGRQSVDTRSTLGWYSVDPRST